MIFDLLLVSPFAALIYAEKKYAGSILLVLAAIAAEFFSPVPPGVSSLALTIAFFITRFFLRTFDASSWVSLSAAFLLGTVTFTFLFAGSVLLATGASMWEMLGRSLVLIVRQLAMGFLLILTIILLEYAIQLSRYAFLEEKI